MSKVWILVVVLAVAVFGVFKWQHSQPTTPVVPESQIKYTNASAKDIVIDLPYSGAVTGKTFSVVGKARGPWYFEASFPIEVRDKDGKLLAIVTAQAQGDWMTENFVPFKAEVTITNSYLGPATLILRKDNPSGLPEHDASVSLPFTIATSTATSTPVARPGKVDTGVEGLTTIGPTCPVERLPPDPACADKPYPTTLVIENLVSDKSVGVVVSTDTKGYFSKELLPGSYSIRAQSSTVMPQLTPITFVVTSHHLTSLNLQFDSGIR